MVRDKIHPIDYQIGQNIKARRILNNMKQAELGYRLDISGAAIAFYESGENRISANTLIRMAKVLNCTVQDLVNGVGDIITAHEKPETAESIIADKQLLECIKSIDDAELRLAVSNMTKAIIQSVAQAWGVRNEI